MNMKEGYDNMPMKNFTPPPYTQMERNDFRMFVQGYTSPHRLDRRNLIGDEVVLCNSLRVSALRTFRYLPERLAVSRSVTIATKIYMYTALLSEPYEHALVRLWRKGLVPVYNGERWFLLRGYTGLRVDTMRYIP